MDLPDRQTEILSILRETGAVEVDDLATRFDLTSQTIRNDLRELSLRGLAVRTHGGARRVASVTSRDHAERRRLNARAKEAIARAAAALIPDGCSVALNIGTTTEGVARALAGHRDLVVLSNNINIIHLMIGGHDSKPAKELILAGGTVRQADGAVIGAEAVELFDRYKVDYAVIGASALDADGAVLDFDAREVTVARAILRNARCRILVADASKFDTTAPVRICGIAEIDHFVTDTAPPAAFARAARAGDTTITLADRTHEQDQHSA